jgi:tetratricopeptide (TPR) repeat protein
MYNKSGNRIIFQTIRVGLIVAAMLWFLGGCRTRPLEINPRDAGAWYNKGVTEGELGQTEEALKCYGRALEINPRYAVAWYNKGRVLGNLGRTEEALKCYDRALEINPRDAEAWYNKGTALYELKRYSQAREAFQRAADLGLPNALQALETLKQEGH